MGRVGAPQFPYPAGPVFRVATRIEDLPKWLPEVVSATLLDAPLAPGSRVRLKLSAVAAGPRSSDGPPAAVAVAVRDRRVGRPAGSRYVRGSTRPARARPGSRSRSTCRRRRCSGSWPGRRSAGSTPSCRLPSSASAPSWRRSPPDAAPRRSGRRGRHAVAGDRHLDQGALLDHPIEVGPPPGAGHAVQQLPPLCGSSRSAPWRRGRRACARLQVDGQPRVGLEVVDPGPRPRAGHAADDESPPMLWKAISIRRARPVRRPSS